MPLPEHEPARGVVAVGASAGGIDALQRLVAQLPPGLPVAVCVVLHIPASSLSFLAQVIARHTTVPVQVATHGGPLSAGHLVVAPPDHHLLVDRGVTLLDRGPKENAVRPAIDPLMRSSATAYGTRAMGIVLSGALGDGAAGLARLAAGGGIAVVQDPDDARVPSMPLAALAVVPGAKRYPAEALGEAITAFADALPALTLDEEEVVEVREELDASPVERSRNRPVGPPAGYTCPECHGPLWEIDQGPPAQYRCRVGHAYYEDALVTAKDDEVEAALWSALEALEERAELMERIAERIERGATHGGAHRYRERQADSVRRAETLRALLVAGDDEREAAGA